MRFFCTSSLLVLSFVVGTARHSAGICINMCWRGCSGVFPNGNQAPLDLLFVVLFGRGNCFAGWLQVLSCYFVISLCLNIRPFFLLLIPNQLTSGLVRNLDYPNALHMLRQTEVSLCNMSLQSVDSLSHYRQPRTGLSALLVLSRAPLMAHLLGHLLSGPRWFLTLCCCHWFLPPWLLLGHSLCPRTLLPHWLLESQAPLMFWIFLC